MFQKLMSFVLLAIVFVSCQSGGGQSWAEGMRGMAEAFEKLFPYMYSEERYSDPNNTKIIATYLGQLTADSESLNKHIAMGLSGNDPMFQLGLKGLKRNLSRAQESFYVESHGYSQKLLQSSLNYCVQCHTRTSLGPNFNVYDKFSNESLQSISKIDLAKLEIATRQFAKSLETLQIYVNENGRTDQEKIRGLKMGVTIALRNLNSYEKAMDFLANTKNLGTLKPIIAQWKRDLKRHPKVSLTQATNFRMTSSKKDLYFVRSLSVSLVLHKALSSETDRSKRAKIYLSLGKIYNFYDYLVGDELPSRYFEACIYENPYTQNSMKCYFALEQLTLKDYKTKSLNQLPEAEQRDMRKLKALTKPRKASTRPAGGHQNL